MTVTVQITDDWRRWVAENLALGVDPDEAHVAMVDAGLDADAARHEINHALDHPYLRACRTVALRYDWVESLLDLYRGLRQASGAHRIDRRRDITAEEFFHRYLYGHRPVVLEGMMEDWPARRWTLPHLANRFGDVEVGVMTERSANPHHAWQYERHHTAMRFADFLAQVAAAGESNDIYMVPRNGNLSQTRLGELLRDVRPPAGIIRPDPTPETSNLLLGPAGTVTPLHHDLHNVLLCQVLGRKHIRLVPSYERHRVYPMGGSFSAVDADNPDFERHPLYRDATVLEVVIEPGQMLFIPAGWWHWVRALDVSITVTLHQFELPADEDLDLMQPAAVRGVATGH